MFVRAILQDTTQGYCLRYQQQEVKGHATSSHPYYKANDLGKEVALEQTNILPIETFLGLGPLRGFTAHHSILTYK